MKFNELNNSPFFVKVEDNYCGYTYKVLDNFQVMLLHADTSDKEQITEIWPAPNNQAVIQFVNGKSQCLRQDKEISIAVYKVVTILVSGPGESFPTYQHIVDETN